MSGTWSGALTRGCRELNSQEQQVLFAAEHLYNCDQIKTNQTVVAHVCDPPTQATEADLGYIMSSRIACST